MRGHKYIQTPDNRLFVLGNPEMWEVKFRSTTVRGYQQGIRHTDAVYKASRASGGDNYFSVCTYRTEALIVTGSMVENMSKKCQHYLIAKDRWSDLPSLNQGRSTHASCTFAARYVMVFGGIDKQYRPMNSIEKFDMEKRRTASWELMTFKSTVLPEM